jgi:hypothetical protein
VGPDRVHFVTATTRGELAATRRLVAALQAHHPGAPVHVARLDHTGEVADTGLARPLDATALRFGTVTFGELAAALPVAELGRLAIPALLAHALDLGAEVAVYLAPSVEVLAPLRELVTAAAAGLCLLPRVVAPLPLDGAHPDDLDAVARGGYRTSLVAASGAGRASVAWWASLAGHAWARGLPPRDLIATVAASVAHAPPADLNQHVQVFTLGNHPLERDTIVTLDLAGYAADRPHRLDATLPTPDRVWLADLPAVAALVEDRCAALAADPAPGTDETEEMVRLSTGDVYDDVMRRVYRDALIDALGAGEAADHPRPPSPFVDAPAFLEWCATSELGGPLPLSRYIDGIRRGRPDLLDAFLEVPGRDTRRYLQWIHEHGQHEQAIPARLMPAPVPALAPVPYLQAGVNLAGFLTAELGVGEVARRLATALDAASVPYATHTFARTTSRTGYDFRADTEPRFDTNLVCVNADTLGVFVHSVGAEFFTGRSTIGVWFWETADLPRIFAPAFANLDEVWAASDFVADAQQRAAQPSVEVLRFP